MKKAVVYARYSCDRQNEQSIDGQLRVCSDYAERNNICIVDTYIDKAMSGTNDNREAFQKMLRDSDRKEWSIVLVYKLDRFSRNKYEMAIHRKHLKDNDIKIVSAMENIPDSPEGILLESLLEGMNQYYSEELSQKTKRGMHETRLKGHFIGGLINYGWSLVPVYSEENGKNVQTASRIVINDEEAEIVKRIFNEYANGKGVTTIVKELNNQGITNRGKPFIESTIYTMINREKYTGKYRVNGYIYENLYPAIIAASVYETVQKRRIENGVGKHVPDVSYLLRGKLDCGYCGKRLTSYGGKDRYGTQRRYYKCYAKNCTCKAVKKELLENIIVDTLNKMLCSDENIELLIVAVLSAINKKTENNTTLNILEKELEKTEKALTNIMNAIKMGIITETTKASLEEYENAKRELNERIFIERKKEKPKPSKEQIRKYILSALAKPSKQMIDLLLDKAVVYNDKIEIYFKYINGSFIDERPKRLNKHITKKQSLESHRDSIFISYVYSYSAVINKTKITKAFVVEVVI